MPAIDFPASPAVGDALMAGANIWQFDGNQWVIVPLGPESIPNYGNAGGGNPSGVGIFLFFDGGKPSSVFGTASSIDAGTL